MRDIGFNQIDYWTIQQGDTYVQRADLGDIDAGSSVGATFKVKYRGTEPIVLVGFHLMNLPAESAMFYTGSREPAKDVHSVLEWASMNVGAGVTITHDNADGVPVVNQIAYGFGDRADNPIPYEGSAGGILGRGDEFEITVDVAVPGEVNSVIDGAGRFNVALAFVWREISPLLLGDRAEQGGC